ncbi:MAG: hypothetical protein IKB06_00220 [Clostridia bacterium]|nr:hypothetical protein [Clostridia bacterium]
MKSFRKFVGMFLVLLIVFVPNLVACSSASVLTYNQLEEEMKKDESNGKETLVDDYYSITVTEGVSISYLSSEIVTNTETGFKAMKDAKIKPVLTTEFMHNCMVFEDGSLMLEDLGLMVSGFIVNKKFYEISHFESNTLTVKENIDISLAYTNVKPVGIAIYQLTPMNAFDENFKISKELKYENGELSVSKNNPFFSFVNLNKSTNTNITNKVLFESDEFKVALEIFVETTECHLFMMFVNENGKCFYLKLANKSGENLKESQDVLILGKTDFNFISKIKLTLSTDIETTQNWG